MKTRHAKAIRKGIVGARLYKAEATRSERRTKRWMIVMSDNKLTWEAFLRTYYGMEKP